MTLQVAFKGSDGVVLASDTKWSETREVRHTYNRTKLTINYERHIVASAARNMDTATTTALGIVTKITDDQWAAPELHIQRIAEEAMQDLPIDQSYGLRDLNCLVVSPTLRLFQVEVTTDLSVGNVPTCWEQDDRAIAGDTKNASLFWAEPYFKRRQPMRTLIPLAAHLIVAGNKLSPDRIEGLEIVVCDRSGVRRLSDDSISDLLSVANETDEKLQALFTDYSRPFTYTDAA
jgi:hypothetical protein